MTVWQRMLTTTVGTNIPGKPKAPLNYSLGVPAYIKTVNEALENNFEGFVVE
jgi:hypothetical protein